MGYILKDYALVRQELMKELNEIDESYSDDPYKREIVEDVTQKIRNWFSGKFRIEKQHTEKYNPFEALKALKAEQQKFK